MPSVRQKLASRAKLSTLRGWRGCGVSIASMDGGAFAELRCCGLGGNGGVKAGRQVQKWCGSQFWKALGSTTSQSSHGAGVKLTIWTVGLWRRKRWPQTQVDSLCRNCCGGARGVVDEVGASSCFRVVLSSRGDAGEGPCHAA